MPNPYFLPPRGLTAKAPRPPQRSAPGRPGRGAATDPRAPSAAARDAARLGARARARPARAAAPGTYGAACAADRTGSAPGPIWAARWRRPPPRLQQSLRRCCPLPGAVRTLMRIQTDLHQHRYTCKHVCTIEACIHLREKAKKHVHEHKLVHIRVPVHLHTSTRTSVFRCAWLCVHKCRCAQTCLFIIAYPHMCRLILIFGKHLAKRQ